MAKRGPEETNGNGHALKQGHRPAAHASNGHDPPPEGGFEDEFEDEFESEDEEIFEAGVDGRPDAEREAEGKDAMDIDQLASHQTFIPGRHKLEAGEALAPDPTAYQLLHALTTPWPCLSFDILRDNLGDARKTYPATVYAVAGTQADSRHADQNDLLVMKLSGLSRMDRNPNEGSDDEDDADSDDENAEAILETRSIKLGSTTNRIRAHRFESSSTAQTDPVTLSATMTEDSELLIHDISTAIRSFDTPGISIPRDIPALARLRPHRTEGYAVAWSPLITEGKILSGANDGTIVATTGRDQGSHWTSETQAFTGHKGSVEDVAWSPNERNVFASASSDGTIKVWDLRSRGRRPAVDVRVSPTDVNVLSWSSLTPHLMATGADDGVWAVWDLRQWKAMSAPGTGSSSSSSTINAKSTNGNSHPAPTAVASFAFHHEQITSVEWHPSDDSVVAVAAADNTVTLWDLAVEFDDEAAETRDVKAGLPADVPSQLLFVHYIEAVKEAHWHPQIPGTVMATGSGGFGVFKTISV